MPTTEWPGYTPPDSGSSRNSGTHPLSSYTGIQDAVRTQYEADGADVTQEPTQYYNGWTVQRRNEGEAHGAPSAPGKPTVEAGGTSGSAKVTWTPSQNEPSGGYRVDASSGQTKTVKGTSTNATISGLTVSQSVTFTVTAIGLTGSATSPASNSYTVT